MDSISSPELAGIFDRVSLTIEMKGAYNAAAIENRLKIARHMCKTNAKIAETEEERKPWAFRAEEYDKLIEHNFSERVIFEAIMRPKGFISQTLLYGREEAERRMRAQRRAAERFKRAYPRVGVRYRPAPEVFPRRPIYRRPRVGRR
jgi:hypothetical protein